MEQSFLTQLGANGPWACVAGFLLYVVIKAWDKDRSTMTELLRDVKPTLDRLATILERHEQNFTRHEASYEKIMDAIREKANQR